MFADGLQGNMFRPTFESITVETETECAGQSDERRPLPIAPEPLHPPEHLFAALHQSLDQERIQPGMRLQRFQPAHQTMTTRVVHRTPQFIVAFANAIRYRQHILCRRQSVTGQCLRIVNSNDMQYGVVVEGIFVMSVTEPVTGLFVYLHIADPQRAVQPEVRISVAGKILLAQM